MIEAHQQIFLHRKMSISQHNAMHVVKVLLFVNECRLGRIPDISIDYYKVRKTGLEIRNNRNLDIPWARTDLDWIRCDIKGARLWNMYFETVNPLLHKKSFRKRIKRIFILIITRGQFWPPGIVIAPVRPSVRHQVCPRDNSSLVQARITKLGPRMQNTMVKVPIVLGGNQLWPSRSNLRSKSSQNLPHFELLRTITHHPFKLGSPNLDQRCKIHWLISLLFWVAIDLDLQGQIWHKKSNFLVFDWFVPDIFVGIFFYFPFFVPKAEMLQNIWFLNRI